MLRIAAIALLLVGCSGLAVHPASGHLKKDPSGSTPFDLPTKQPVQSQLPKEMPEELPRIFQVVPKWLTEAVMGVAGFEEEGASQTEHVPKEHVQAVPPAVTREGMPPPPYKIPVPTVTKCIVIMCVQYMIAYTALALCRTYHDFSGTCRGNVEAGLKAAAQTLTYGPMLCAVFIACRMWVEFLSDASEQPKIWVQNSMYAATFGVSASTLLVLFMPLIAGRAMPLKEDLGDLEMPHYFDKPHTTEDPGLRSSRGMTLTVARYLILLGLFGGLYNIIVGIQTYVPPGATDVTKLPLPSAAVACTMILAVAFFATQLVIAVCRTYEEFTGIEYPAIVGIMSATTTVAEFAPMLAILFLSAHMRALQHNDQPQLWAQNCMFMATGSMCVAMLLALLIPLLMGGQLKVNPRTRQRIFVAPDPMLGYVFLVLRFICMLSFYGGAGGVIYSIFTFEAPIGATLPVSPTVQCVVALTCQFLFVYFLMTVVVTVSEVSGGIFPLQSYFGFSAIEAAQTTLAFAPMLSILFVTTRMDALLITDKKGSPQAWVQCGMFIATWSLLMSCLACLFTGLTNAAQIDKNGNIVQVFSNRHLALVITIVRYVTTLLLYGGITMVIVGIFFIGGIRKP